MANRRSFLGKLGAALAGAVVAPQLKAQEEQHDMQVIKNIRPLGFQWATQDPFLFCVHHEDYFPAGNEEMGPVSGIEGRNLGQDFLIKDGYRMYHGRKVPGFPGHPHRGFETVTVVRKGIVDHTDSLGAAGRYGEGDVQWMTAGKGIQHAEMFPLIHADKENTMELFQIWLNLPKKDKMVEPHFKMLWGNQIPVFKEKDADGNGISIEVIAGAIGAAVPPSPPPNSWAAANEHQVAIWNIELAPNASFELPKAKTGVNRSLYFYKGSGLAVNGEVIPDYHGAELLADQRTVVKNGAGTSKLLILQGQPIAEPVVQHGPFVMNTRQEIQQAFADYQQTGFGGWPWPRYDQVHDRDAQRFARHADGREERP